MIKGNLYILVLELNFFYLNRGTNKSLQLMKLFFSQFKEVAK